MCAAATAVMAKFVAPVTPTSPSGSSSAAALAMDWVAKADLIGLALLVGLGILCWWLAHTNPRRNNDRKK